MGDFTKRVDDFRAYVKKTEDYKEAVQVIGWDMRTGIPKKGVAQRSEVVGTLSAEIFRMQVSDQMGSYLDELSDPAVLRQLDEITRQTVLECKKEYERSKKIPPELFREYVVLTSNAESAWEEAHHHDDFSAFQPYLEKIVKLNQEFVEIWGYTGNKYNTLLDYYEPGMTVDQLDALFRNLRSQTLSLLEKIESAGQKPQTDLDKPYDVGLQKEFCLFVLRSLGYDFEAGRLDQSLHPFATGLNPGDVRITTRFREQDVRAALFGCIHEFGHALYEQNISPDLIGTPLCEGTSMGIHESQSRFWENAVGRSHEFWQFFYPKLVKQFPAQLAGISVDEFYRGANQVRPSLIRVEADELTYNLHIMLRYELEKGLINGDIQVADLPEIWNRKMKEYLGVVPTTNREGVLQDVHWSGGSFGYFPSYSLGNIYAAQFAAALEREVPDYKQRVREGDFAPLRAWLKKKIHQYGKLRTPGELLKEVTGGEINATYLAQYLENKYREVYSL